MPLPTPAPTPAPGPDPVDLAARITAPCPCGRSHSLADCCLPMAQRLRAGPERPNPSPFDEIRASCALLLWGSLSRAGLAASVRGHLSAAARRFWGPAMTGVEAVAPGLPTDSRVGRDVGVEDGVFGPAFSPAPTGDATDEATAYGLGLFERTWGSVEPGTLGWLIGALPTFVRADPLVGELTLDWLLWDEPWLRGRPAGKWLLRNPSVLSRERVQRTGRSILRSRVGLWRLEEAAPPDGIRVRDVISGLEILLHTPGGPWPDPERLLLGRVYGFGRWHLVGGRCLLLDPTAVSELLTLLRHRRRALGGPAPDNPAWLGWIKTQMIPIAVNQWLGSRLALPSPGRYHGAHRRVSV